MQVSHRQTSYSTVAAVIPALNEEESLPRVLHGLKALGTVIVVDNGSTDRTAEVARDAGAVVVSEPRRGYGIACQSGIREAMLSDPQVIVIVDADDSVDLSELASLVDPILQNEADLVLGDRTERAEPGSLTSVQRFGNALAITLIDRFTGHRYRDMGPFRAIRTDALLALQMDEPTWGWNVEMQMKAVRHGLRIREVAVAYRPRYRGESKISGSVRGATRAGTRILLAAIRYR